MKLIDFIKQMKQFDGKNDIVFVVDGIVCNVKSVCLSDGKIVFELS